MKGYWTLKDFVFAAFMTIGMLVVGFVVAPLVPTGFQLLAWAPFGGIFLTLGMARLQKRGSVALMILPFALLLGIVSPLITLYLGCTVVTTEIIVALTLRNYRAKASRLLGNMLFFGGAALFGLIIFAYVIGSDAAQFILDKPWIIGVMAIASAIAGALGWWLGEIVVSQLRRAGKLDAES